MTKNSRQALCSSGKTPQQLSETIKLHVAAENLDMYSDQTNNHPAERKDVKRKDNK